MGVVIGRFFIMSCKSLKLAKGSIDEEVVTGLFVSIPANRFPEVGWARGVIVGIGFVKFDGGLMVGVRVFPEIALIGGMKGVAIGFGDCFVVAGCTCMAGCVGCVVVILGVVVDWPIKIFA